MSDYSVIRQNQLPSKAAVYGADEETRFILRSAERNYLQMKAAGKVPKVTFVTDPTITSMNNWQFIDNETGRLFSMDPSIDTVEFRGKSYKNNYLNHAEARKLYKKEFGNVYRMFDEDLAQYLDAEVIGKDCKPIKLDKVLQDRASKLTGKKSFFERRFMDIDHADLWGDPFGRKDKNNLRLLDTTTNKRAGIIKRLDKYKNNPELLKKTLDDIGYNRKFNNTDELIKFYSDVAIKPKGSGVQFSSIGGVFDDALKSPLTKKAYGLARKLGVEFEAAFIALDFMNNLGKGIEPGESLQRSLQTTTFQLYKGGDRKTIENIKKVAKELGFDPQVMDSLIKANQSQLKIGDLKKKISSYEGALVNLKSSPNKRIPSKWISDVEKKIPKLKKELDKEIEIGTNLFKTYATNVKRSKGSFKLTEDDVNKSFTELQTAAFTKLKRERLAKAKEKSTQVDVEAGPIGDVIQNALGGLWTYPKFAYDVINPFSPLPKMDAWKTEGMKEKERIIDMQKRGGPGELYRYNIARGFDIDQPVTGQAVETMKEKQPYLGLASGGLANLTRTVAPDSGPMAQGLRSLYINDRDY